MRVHGKRYRAAAATLEPRKLAAPREAVDQVKAAAYAKFDKSVDIAVRLPPRPHHPPPVPPAAPPLPPPPPPLDPRATAAAPLRRVQPSAAAAGARASQLH